MIRVLPFLLCAAVVCAACNQDPPPVPTTPAPVTTETIAGTVQPGGTDVHTFAVTLSNGLLTMTLTTAGPPSNVMLFVALGQPDATGACAPLANASVSTAAGPGPHISGSVNAATYCSLVADPGGAGALAAAVNYTVVVTHY